MNELKILPVDKMFQVIQLCGMAEEIWREHFTPIIGAEQVEYMLDKFQSPHALQEQLDEGYQYFIFSEQDSDLGYMGIKPGEDKLFLSKLYVHKDSRRKGVARHAIDFLIDFCRQGGMNAIWLTVNKHNTGTIAAYEKLGFKIVREQVADIGNGFVMDDYIMEKPVK